MTKINIKNRLTGDVQFSYSYKYNTLKMTVREAVKSKAILRYADLAGADLKGGNLAGADLSFADLRGANLTGADLMGADLTEALLADADLEGADLSGAVLGANDNEDGYGSTDMLVSRFINTSNLESLTVHENHYHPAGHWMILRRNVIVVDKYTIATPEEKPNTINIGGKEYEVTPELTKALEDLKEVSDD